MPYEIKKQGEKFCVFKEGSDKSLGCHDTEAGAEAQIQAIGAATHSAVWITLEQMNALCPKCAESMTERGLSRINVSALRQIPEQLLAGLCDRIGGSFDTCMGMSFGDFAPADKESFCAWLHHECTGAWPGERSIPLRADDKVAYGSPLRALGDGKVGGYVMVFSDGSFRDAYGTIFDRETEYGWEIGENRLALYDHGMDPVLGTRSLGDGWTLRRIDDVGLWAESQLNLADEYEEKIYGLIETGHPDDGRPVMGLSSGVAEHLIVCDEDGRMRRWIISEGSYTVVPADPRTRGFVSTLRSYKPTSLKSLVSDSGNRTGDAQGDLAEPEAETTAGTGHNRNTTTKTLPKRRRPGGKRKMDISKLVEMLKANLELTEEQNGKLDMIAQSYAMGSGEMDAHMEGGEYTEGGEMMDAQAVMSLLKEWGIEAPAKKPEPKTPKPKFAGQRGAPPYSFPEADPEEDKAKKQTQITRAVNVMRHGDIDEPTSLVMSEVYGGDYRQALHDQHVAFMRYLRTGRDTPILQRQLWGIRDVRSMLRNGLSVAAIRATMVEGADELGGYAVPPDMQDEIIRRIKGLTAVRGGGALEVQTASNMVEWIKITGGNDRYPSSMRGSWGDETTDGPGDNFEIGLVQIPVNIYSYYVDFSRSLLEDASNLEQVFTGLVSDTLAIDEDEAFLIGDGANKPRGILPNSSNTDSLTEKALSKNGTGSDITVEGVKGLRRGIASQYRGEERSSWVANSATGEEIELFQDGEGRFYYQYLDHEERFMRSAWRESEAMPDIAASAYPMIFADLSGYAIIERLGMSIERFHDSATGVKKYRFAIYRRLGGRVIESWKFAVGKVATSV